MWAEPLVGLLYLIPIFISALFLVLTLDHLLLIFLFRKDINRRKKYIKRFNIFLLITVVLCTIGLLLIAPSLTDISIPGLLLMYSTFIIGPLQTYGIILLIYSIYLFSKKKENRKSVLIRGIIWLSISYLIPIIFNIL